MALSTTASTVLGLNNQILEVTPAVPYSKTLQLAAINMEAAHALKAVNTPNADVAVYRGRMDHIQNVLTNQPTKTAYEYLQSIMQTMQSYKGQILDLETTLDQLKKFANDWLAIAKFKEIVADIKEGKPRSLTDGKIDKLEKDVSELAKSINKFDINASNLEERLRDFDRKTYKAVEGLTGQSLGEPTPSPTATPGTTRG